MTKETLKDVQFSTYAARGIRPLTRLEKQQHEAMRTAIAIGDQATINRMLNAMVKQNIKCKHK